MVSTAIGSLKESLNQVFDREVLPVLCVHLFFSIIIAGFLSYFFIDLFGGFLEKTIIGLGSFVPNKLIGENVLTAITNLILYFTGWFIFIYILIPTSSVVGIFFENKILEKVVKLRGVKIVSKNDGVSLFKYFRVTIKYVFMYIFFNLLAIPFYITLPFANIIIFVLINGFILSKQTYHGILLDYLPDQEINKSLVNNRKELFFLGVALTTLFILPIFNFFASLLSTIVFVNFFVASQKI